MFRYSSFIQFIIAAAAMVLPTWSASAALITFEGFADSTPITNQIAGVTFTHATVLTAGVSLNEFEFPPHAGTNVVFDDGGAMTIVFASPQSSVSAFITYSAPVTFRAFNGANSLLASVSSAFSINAALSGDPGSAPNEVFAIASAGISKLIITGDPGGSSFALDDLTFSARAVTVPEPGSLLLVLWGVGLLVLRPRLWI